MVVVSPKILLGDLSILGLNANTINRVGLVAVPMQVNKIRYELIFPPRNENKISKIPIKRKSICAFKRYPVFTFFSSTLSMYL